MVIHKDSSFSNEMQQVLMVIEEVDDLEDSLPRFETKEAVFNAIPRISKRTPPVSRATGGTPGPGE